MQGCKGNAFFDCLNHIFVDKHRGGKFFSAVDHAVAGRSELVQACYDSLVAVQEQIDDIFKGDLVVWNIRILGYRA